MKIIAIKEEIILAAIAILLIAGCSSTSGYHSPASRQSASVWSQSNSRIQHFEKTYQKGSHLRVSLERCRNKIPYIRDVLRDYGVPEQLAYLPILESSCRTDAVSPTGARGLWQFTEATAEDYGLTVSWFKDDREDWRKSTHAAARYLRVLGKRYNGNWELALAAYNGGPGYISNKMKKQGSQNYWNLKLRQEVRDYVPRFIAIYRISHRQYGHLVAQL